MTTRLFFLISVTLILASFSLAKTYEPKGTAIALTEPGEFYVAPQWSPDGKALAAGGPSYNGLYVIAFPTGTVEAISTANAAGYGFAWSHDGQSIVSRISSYENMRRYHTLVVFDIFEGRMTALHGPVSQMMGKPRWSNDDHVVYLNFGVSDQVVDRQGALLNGNILSGLLVRDGQLIHTDETGSTRTLFPEQDRVTSMAVSPDGELVVFSTSGQNLWISDMAGSFKRSLGQGIAPSWSPDGQWFTYMLTADDGHDMLNSDIYIMSIDGKINLNLTQTPDVLEMHPQWSPDGHWIVYDTESQGQLFMQQVEGR